MLETFQIPAEVLANFLAAVGSRYHPNPYHNFNHGVHVLLGSWLLARDELHTVRSTHMVEKLTQLHILALLVAAVGHDVDHPGVNNAFLCNTNAPLAMRYNDQSVLENHHAATTFEILADKRCNMLAALSYKQRQEVRSLMIGCILATDMAHHQAMVKDLALEAHKSQSETTAGFTLKVLCHVADLGNCAIRWDLSKVWAQRVCDEATAQASREQQMGLPFGKTTPYTDEELMARQLVFLDGWVKPLFKAAAIIYPGCKARLAAIQDCREACKTETRKHADGRVSMQRSTMEARDSQADGEDEREGVSFVNRGTFIARKTVAKASASPTKVSAPEDVSVVA